MKEQFIDHKFNSASMEIIEKANEFIEEYEDQGLILSLRQLFYRFVSTANLPNTQRDYKRLGDIISNARLAGLVDWDMMEDRTRVLRTRPSWDSPKDILESVADQYREDLWKNQKVRPELWVEKDALEPSVISELIESAVLELRHPTRWAEALENEEYNQTKLLNIYEHYHKTALVVPDEFKKKEGEDE